VPKLHTKKRPKAEEKRKLCSSELVDAKEVSYKDKKKQQKTLKYKELHNLQ
jgi:hypothetical protein